MNPSHGDVSRDPDRGLRIRWLTAPCRRRSAVESCASQPLRFTRADPIKRGRDTAYRPFVVMECSLCGVRGLDPAHIPCSAHIGTGSQTYENQRSKQVTVASSTSPYERCDRLYPIPDVRKQTLENKLLVAICKGISGTEIIEISD